MKAGNWDSGLMGILKWGVAEGGWGDYTLIIRSMVVNVIPCVHEHPSVDSVGYGMCFFYFYLSPNLHSTCLLFCFFLEVSQVSSFLHPLRSSQPNTILQLWLLILFVCFFVYYSSIVIFVFFLFCITYWSLFFSFDFCWRGAVVKTYSIATMTIFLFGWLQISNMVETHTIVTTYKVLRRRSCL